MTKRRAIEEIKNGSRVMSALVKELTFHDVQCRTSLSRAAVQKALADLSKNGYVCKNSKGLWAAVETDHE